MGCPLMLSQKHYHSAALVVEKLGMELAREMSPVAGNILTCCASTLGLFICFSVRSLLVYRKICPLF